MFAKAHGILHSTVCVQDETPFSVVRTEVTGGRGPDLGTAACFLG